MLSIFKVTDSDVHWVIAEDESDAVAVVCEAHNLDPDDVSASVVAMTREQAEATPYYDEDGEKIGTLWSEYESGPFRSYVGGTVS